MGQYFETEEIYHGSIDPIGETPGHIILFDFPRTDLAQLNAVLDDLVRSPRAQALSILPSLIEQLLTNVQNCDLTRVSPLQANPIDPYTREYYHAPKRRRDDGKWHLLPLAEQLAGVTSNIGHLSFRTPLSQLAAIKMKIVIISSQPTGIYYIFLDFHFDVKISNPTARETMLRRLFAVFVAQKIQIGRISKNGLHFPDPFAKHWPPKKL